MRTLSIIMMLYGYFSHDNKILAGGILLMIIYIARVIHMYIHRDKMLLED